VSEALLCRIVLGQDTGKHDYIAEFGATTPEESNNHTVVFFNSGVDEWSTSPLHFLPELFDRLRVIRRSRKEAFDPRAAQFLTPHLGHEHEQEHDMA
jgi:DNA-binding response OmpR family regulator